MNEQDHLNEAQQLIQSKPGGYWLGENANRPTLAIAHATVSAASSLITITSLLQQIAAALRKGDSA